MVVDLESLEIVDSFQRFVQTQIKPLLADFSNRLTSIPADVDGAGTYKEVGQELGEFLPRYSHAA